jgi:single-strand DNA-binding protein
MTSAPIFLEGNLTEDPETAVGESGVKYTRFTIAVDTRRPDGTGGFVNGEPEFHRVTAFGALGENSAAQLRSGDRVVVGGELQFRSWTDKDTERRRTSTEIIAHNVGASTRFDGSVTVNREGRRAGATPTGPAAAPTEPARGRSLI